MHLLLTDRLACPRCGAGFGLILRADKLVDRRVIEGGLGCPNCRDRFPIVDGFADLRPPPRGDLPAAPARGAVEPAETDALAALLGVTEGPGNIGVVGALSAHAGGLADRIQGVEIVRQRAQLALQLDEVERHPRLVQTLGLERGLDHVAMPVQPLALPLVVAQEVRGVVVRLHADRVHPRVSLAGF